MDLHYHLSLANTFGSFKNLCWEGRLDLNRISCLNCNPSPASQCQVIYDHSSKGIRWSAKECVTGIADSLDSNMDCLDIIGPIS